MSDVQDKARISSACRIYTQYPHEEYTFTWNISNFSKIFNSVCTEFTTTSKATKWQLRLLNRNRVELRRCFEGEPVNVNYVSTLVGINGNLRKDAAQVFTKIYDHCIISILPEIPVEEEELREKVGKSLVFENDIFDLQCTLSIEGHSISNTVESGNIPLLNSTQLSLDLKELFRRKQHCDLTIAVGDVKIQVHKVILCTRSPVFDKKFEHDALEKGSKQIDISDIDIDVFQEFISFLYSGEVKELCWDRAMKLYNVADKYEVKDLRMACSQFLAIHMTVEKACSALILADSHGDEKLKNAAKYLIQMYSSVVKSMADWKELINTHPALAADVFK